MGIYIFLILLCLILDFLNRNNALRNKDTKYLFWIVCLFFTAISMFRYNVGTDYSGTYTHAFLWLQNGASYNYEYLFLKLNYLIINLGGNVTHLMTLCSLIIVPSFFVFIYKNVEKKYWFLACFLLIGTTVYYASMNVVRQYLAIAIVLYSYSLLKNKKYIKYALINVFASFFHTSILFNLLLLGLYFVFEKTYNKKSGLFFILIYIISLIGIFVDFRFVFNIFSFALPSRYLVYLNTVFIKKKNLTAIYKIILPNLLFLFSLRYKDEFSKSNKTLYPLFAIYVYNIISNMFYGINVFIRITWFVDFYFIVFIPQLLEIIYEKSKIKNKDTSIRNYNGLVIFIVLYFIALNILSIFYLGGHGVVPYKSIFSK